MSKRDGRPRHQQIAADLRARIMSGDLAPGTQLPSTQQLVEQYAAANATIQRALGALKDEGFVYSHVGKGVYVRDKQPFVVQVAAYLAPSPKGYAYRLLDVAEDVPVIRQFRVIYSDEHRPVEASVLIKGGHLYELLYQQTIS